MQKQVEPSYYLLNENLAVKIKVAILWIITDFSFILLFTLNSFDPNGNGGIKQMITGLPSQQEPLALLGGATLLVIPLVLAFLSLTLKESVNRRENMTVGIVLTIFQIVSLGYGLSKLSVNTAYLTLSSTVGFVAPALIVWYTYKWSKERARPIRTLNPVLKEAARG